MFQCCSHRAEKSSSTRQLSRMGRPDSNNFCPKKQNVGRRIFPDCGPHHAGKELQDPLLTQGRGCRSGLEHEEPGRRSVGRDRVQRKASQDDGH